MATHTCEAGSALTTDLTTRTCGVTGDWSGSPLVCAGMGPPHTYSTNHSHYLTGTACPDLTDLHNGVISYNTVSVNGYRRVTAVATHTCDTGFTLTNGTSVRTCTAGAWDGSEPTCTSESVEYLWQSLFLYNECCKRALANASRHVFTFAQKCYRRVNVL